MNTTTKITALSATALMVLGLTACNTSEEPAPTASETPSETASAPASPSASESSPAPVDGDPLGPVTDAPETEEGAVESAFKTLERYIAATDKRSVSGEGSMEQIEELATGAQLREDEQYYESAESDGIYAEGSRAVEMVDGFTSGIEVSGEEYPLYGVQLQICNDTSNITYFEKDGTAIEKPQLERLLATATVIFDPTREQWLVQDYGLDEGNAEC